MYPCGSKAGKFANVSQIIEQKISPQGFARLQERILRGEAMGEDVTRVAMMEVGLLPVPTKLVVVWEAGENT
jgi:hypothetical protein